MKHSLIAMTLAIGSLSACTDKVADTFDYTDEQFADIQMLRYRVEGFEQLSLKHKT